MSEIDEVFHPPKRVDLVDFKPEEKLKTQLSSSGENKKVLVGNPSPEKRSLKTQLLEY